MAPRGDNNELERERDRRERVESAIFDTMHVMQRDISSNTTDIAVIKARIAMYAGAIGIVSGIIGAWGSEALKHMLK